MSSVTLVGVTGIIILLFVINGEAIYCWVCSSESDKHCGDPFNATHFSLLDCDRDRSHSSYLQSLAVCRKLKKRVNNEIFIDRSCNWEVSKGHDNGPCSQSAMAPYIKMEYCTTCSTDACNGSFKVSSSSFMFLVSLLASFILRY